VESRIKNITVWFDECHWGIEKMDKECFWFNSNIIQYRIFTTASPDKPFILDNPDIFGELFNPITMKELIELKWLAPIKPLVFEEDKPNVNINGNILDNFGSRFCKWGFSFHNTKENAFELFIIHYKLYNVGETTIKPFILVSKDDTEKEMLKFKDVALDYNFKSIDCFEQTIYSVGYVVAKYSMGYDFNKLDFICISDPKLSTQDIIQCIGRGIRSDGYGPSGSNKFKELILSLPVYINKADVENSPYHRIIDVLRYLNYNVGIPLSEIVFIVNNKHCSLGNGNGNSNGNGDAKDYSGDETVNSTILDLLNEEMLRRSQGTTYLQSKKLLKDIVKDEEFMGDIKAGYLKLCDKYTQLAKDPEVGHC
jgi:hypothetical protein